MQCGDVAERVVGKEGEQWSGGHRPQAAEPRPDPLILFPPGFPDLTLEGDFGVVPGCPVGGDRQANVRD